MVLQEARKNWLYTALKSVNNVNSLGKKAKRVRSVDVL